MKKNYLLLSILSWSFLCFDAQAHRPIFSEKTAISPETAVIITEPDVSQVIYREITENTPQVWLAFDVDEDSELFIQIGIPVLDRLKNFRPAMIVIGPGLPEGDFQVEIPNGMGGRNFLTDEVKEPRFFHEHFTGTDSWILRSEIIVLPNSGRHYVVAYVPSKEYGKLWLSIGKKEVFGAADLVKFGEWKKRIRRFHEIEEMSGGVEIPILSELSGFIKSADQSAQDRKVIDPCEAISKEQGSKYLNAVRTFANNVLKYGRDTYGPKHTPLFVDGLNIHTHDPVKWIDPDGTRWILSNFASQQTLLRTLDGLTAITGDPKYRQAAMEAIRHVFENLQAPNGLLYWGQSTAYDALRDKVHTDGNRHVLKVHYPYYDLMWQVNPEATKRYIDAYWSAHIIDWSNLDMDRIASLTEVLEEPWNHVYKGGPVFFKGKGAAFLSTGLSLIHAGITLHKFSDQEQPYIWSMRLARRYIDTRHPKTGISAFLYNNPWNTLGDDMKEHFVNPYTTLFPLLPFDSRYTQYPEDAPEAEHWISMLLVGKMLGEEGREFTQWALEELTAWGKASYRKKDNSFAPILTDGTSIEGYVLRTLPEGLNVAKPLPVDALFLWAYTLVYRATGDRFIWEMVRDIASGNIFGDIGKSPDDRPQLKMGASCSNPYGILGFLELYAKTNKPEFLQMARCIGDNIINKKCHKGFFVPSKNHIYSRFDCFEPLALLHLYAAIKSQSGRVPQVWPSNPLFLPPYRYQRQGVDRRLIYTLTETTEPPLSLQEAAAIGDLDVVDSLLDMGEPINGSDDSLRGTALHRAAMSGHLEVVELLLDKGARIDAQDNFPGGTALDYAAENGHKDVVELLIARGADINAARRGYPAGDTPLHSAVRAGHKNIVDLLITKKADLNAKNKAGQTPLDIAIRRNRKNIVELLRKHGANE